MLPPPAFTDLRARLQAGEPTFGAFAGLDSPSAVEYLARAGFDWLIIDLEHGAGSEATLLAHLHAATGTGCAPLVRPQSWDRLPIGRALDFGAHGIMAPRIDTADQARQVVSFLRYPPDEIRGLALPTRGAGLLEIGHADVRSVNQQVVGIIQIESASAVAAAPEIAAIDGVDVLFVGPTDLSHSLGVPGQFGAPVYLEALRAVVAATREHGKQAGILLRDLDALDAHRDLGFGFLALGSDGSYLLGAARAALGRARAGDTT